MRRRSDGHDNADSFQSAGANTGPAEFPAFAVDDWMDRIKSGSPKEPKYAYYAYMRSRQQWCRDRGINIYQYANRGRT